MAQTSSIEWTDTTWNPSTGCSKVSTGCKNCYAETMAARLQRMGSSRYDNGFDFTMHWDKIEEPLSWRKPRKVFVNSMSDLFHENSTLEFVRAIFDVMQQTPRHRFQVLTKRPDKMATWLTQLQQSGDYTPASHIWLGTSIENNLVVERAEHLRETPAVVRFLSCEPLLGPLDHLELAGLDWVIVGGESGTHLWDERAQKRRGLVEYLDGSWVPREARSKWVEDLRDRCVSHDIPFFFKQWGGATSKAGGRSLQGREWSEYPAQAVGSDEKRNIAGA